MKAEPKKSKFMEEWDKIHAEIGAKDSYVPGDIFPKIMQLIDKHKADK